MAPPIVVRNLLSDNAFSELQQFIVHTVRHAGEFDETFHRTVQHQNTALNGVHDGLAPFASELFGIALKPSYSFISNYLDGGRCPLHADRPQCFRTIDYLVASDNPEPWPLRIAEPWTDEQWDAYDGERKLGIVKPGTEPNLNAVWHDVYLNPNDAACYSGTHSWHYRPTVAKGRVDLIFFHFVSEDFDGPLN